MDDIDMIRIMEMLYGSSVISQFADRQITPQPV